MGTLTRASREGDVVVAVSELVYGVLPCDLPLHPPGQRPAAPHRLACPATDLPYLDFGPLA